MTARCWWSTRKGLVHLHRPCRHRRDHRRAPGQRSSWSGCALTSTAPRLEMITGPTGELETLIVPAHGELRGIALIAHPNPTRGGTHSNKVVQTSLRQPAAVAAWRIAPPARRGRSGGQHDRGIGEGTTCWRCWPSPATAICRRCWAVFHGTFVMAQVAQQVAAERIVLCGPAVGAVSPSVPPHTLVIHGEQDEGDPAGRRARLGATTAVAGGGVSRLRPFLSRPADAFAALGRSALVNGDSHSRSGRQAIWRIRKRCAACRWRWSGASAFGLLGPNGAGKTTTLRMCLGLSAPDAGRIELLGLPVPQAAREARLRVGVVPQIDNLDPDFSVEENLLVYGRYFGLSDATIRARIPDLLDFAGLANRRRAPIRRCPAA